MRKITVSLPSHCHDYSNSSQASIAVDFSGFFDNTRPPLNILPVSGQDNLSFTIDLDAMAGIFKLKEFSKVIKSSINLSIGSNHKKSPINSIKSKEYVKVDGNYKLVKTLPYSKIGTFDSDIGLIDLYIFAKNDSCSTDHFKNKIYNIFHSVLSSNNISLSSTQFIKQKVVVRDDLTDNNTITGYLLNDDLSVVFEQIYLHMKREKPLLLIETFGNKKDTMVKLDSSELIIKRLINVIPKKYIDKIKIDICISVSSGQSSITLANSKFFNTLNVDPNYQPFMSNAFLNLNKHTINMKSGKRNNIGKRMKTDKVNFYSTMVRVFNTDSRKTYKTPCAFNLFKSNLFNLSLSGKLVNRTKDDILRCEALFKKEYEQSISKEYPYRLEFRCSPLELDEMIDSIKPYLLRSNFSAINSDTCFKYLLDNISIFQDAIFSGLSKNGEVYSPDKLIFTILSELILLNQYIKGQVQIPMINKDMRQIVVYDSPEAQPCLRMIAVEKLLKRVEFQYVGTNTKKALIGDLIKYNAFNKNKIKNEHMKSIFTSLIDMYYSHGKLEDRIKRLMIVYIDFFKQEHGKDLDECSEFFCDQSKPICIREILKETFIKKESVKRSNALQLGFSMISHMNNISQEELIISIGAFAKENGFKSMYNPKTKGRTRVNIDYLDDHTTVLNRNRQIIWEQFIINLQRVDSKVSPDIEELVRFVNGLFMYRNSQKRLLDVFNDFSYGFYMIRSVYWIKNRLSYINKIALKESSFRPFMQKVRSWHPSCFTLEQRKKYHFDCNIPIPEHKSHLYISLIECDTQKWEMNFKNVFIENDFHDVDIFTTVIPVAKKNELDLNMIYSWYENNADFHECNLPNIRSTMSSFQERSELTEKLHSESEFSNCSIIFSHSVFSHIPEESAISDHNSLNESEDDYIVKSEHISDINDAYLHSYEIDHDIEMKNSEELFELQDHSLSEMENLCISSRKVKDEHLIITEKESNSEITKKKQETHEAILSPNPLNNQELNTKIEISDLELCRELLYKRYKYNSFSKSLANKYIFHSSNRMFTHTWNDMIKKLVREKAISQIGCRYKINLKRSDNKYLSFDEIVNGMKKLCKKHSWFTVNQLRFLFDSNKRPYLAEAQLFVESLMKEGIIKTTNQEKETKRIKYRLI